MSDVTISLSGNGFALTVPSDLSGRTHTLDIPLNLGGLKIIRKALMARQQETDRRIGTPASPTQSMVEAWLVEERRMAREKPLVIEGLDLSNIDLDL